MNSVPYLVNLKETYLSHSLYFHISQSKYIFFLFFTLKMDPYDRRIINSLKGGITKESSQLLSDAGFSHNTLRQHLDNLVDASLVVRLKRPKEGPGRPGMSTS
jgi:hypothetical protein